MTDGPLQFALREWRDQFRHPVTLVLLSAVAAALAIVAPYGTAETLRPLPRLGYWAVIVPATYATGSLVVSVLNAKLPPWPFLLRMGLAGSAAGFMVAAVVLGQNVVLLAHLPDAADLPGFVLSIAGVAVVVTLAIGVVLRQQTHHAHQPTPPAPPAILQRLPVKKRGTLLALSVEDHYVRVQTVKGSEMLLMRLSDAIKETGTLRGAQVHRSHWVSFAAVRSARRDGDRAILTLVSGDEIPVSRANLSKVKEAGLLPR